MPLPTSTESLPSAGGLHERFVARQPIFDKRLRVFGYELLFRAGPENFFQQQEEASTRAIVDATMVFDLDALTGTAKAFVNLSQSALLRGAARLLPPARTVLEILEGVQPTPEVLRVCTQLRSDGYTLALDDFADHPKWKPLTKLVKILKVDFRALDAEARQSIAKRYLPKGLDLVAEKVETQEEAQEARKLGYQYFQGFFFCKPLMVSGRDIPAAKLTCLRLLKATAVPEMSFREVERILKQEPGLVYKLLRYLNSPLMGFRNEVHGVRDAIVLLGEDGFRRWVSIVALVSMVGDKPPELIHIALLRAHFCEEIALQTGRIRERSDFFLMGLLSVIDALLDQPMAEALGHLALSDDVRTALCGSRNFFREVYDAVVAYERADWGALSSIAGRIGVAETHLPDCYRRAAFESQLIAR